jgi:hypothetical protein
MLVLAGIGLAGALALTVALVRRPRRKARWLPGRLRSLPRVEERSFLGEATRQLGLTLVGVLARRLAQSVPLPASQVDAPSSVAATQ